VPDHPTAVAPRGGPRYGCPVRRSLAPGEDQEFQLVAVSPRHAVRLALEYVALIRRAPSTDFVVRTITRREANGMPLMSADIVIASASTRERLPAARTYPLHFRKTFYPGRLHGDPRIEFERHRDAARVIGIPEPIGFSDDTFRSCFLPGLPYDRLSPFGVEPEEANLLRARDLPLASAAGLWRLTEEAFRHLTALHEAGLAHGDAELHNFIVCPSPLEVVVIDFEVALRRDAVDAETWEKTCRKDLAPLLREATFLQCLLGQQPGGLAETAWERMDELFKRPDPFRREIDRSTSPTA
jgi:hypothetical protein